MLFHVIPTWLDEAEDSFYEAQTWKWFLKPVVFFDSFQPQKAGPAERLRKWQDPGRRTKRPSGQEVAKIWTPDQPWGEDSNRMCV